MSLSECLLLTFVTTVANYFGSVITVVFGLMRLGDVCYFGFDC